MSLPGRSKWFPHYKRRQFLYFKCQTAWKSVKCITKKKDKLSYIVMLQWLEALSVAFWSISMNLGKWAVEWAMQVSLWHLPQPLVPVQSGLQPTTQQAFQQNSVHLLMCSQCRSPVGTLALRGGLTEGQGKQQPPCMHDASGTKNTKWTSSALPSGLPRKTGVKNSNGKRSGLLAREAEAPIDWLRVATTHTLLDLHRADQAGMQQIFTGWKQAVLFHDCS